MNAPAKAIDFSRGGDWARDPRHVLFVLARYKFVAKMLAGMGQVLEVGAGDGVASEIVAQEVGTLVCTDVNPASDRVVKHDILASRFGIGFHAAFALDVIEHIPAETTAQFLSNLHATLMPHGTCIIGSPSLESQMYASENSRAGHVNCMTARQLRTAMRAHFPAVFMFGMNDEVVHTGFDGMRHYNFALGVK